MNEHLEVCVCVCAHLDGEDAEDKFQVSKENKINNDPTVPETVFFFFFC